MLYLDLSLSIPPINCSHLWNVTWVFHWETRRQHHHTLCCLSVHGTQVYRNQLPMGWGRDRKGPWRTAPLLPVCRSVSRRANCEAGTLCHHSQFIDRGNSKLNHVVGWGADVNENMVTEICAKEGLPVLLYWKNKLYYKKKKDSLLLFWSQADSRTKDRLLKKTHCWLSSVDLWPWRPHGTFCNVILFRLPVNMYIWRHIYLWKMINIFFSPTLCLSRSCWQYFQYLLHFSQCIFKSM